MMRRVRASHLKWSNLLLIGVLVLLSFSLRPAYIQPVMTPEKEKIGFIGDSITHGKTGQEGPIEAELAMLKGNTAINRAVSGTTSGDWLPGRGLFDDTLTIFKTHGVHTVSVMLGTNDARKDKSVAPATYRRNMERIIRALLDSGVVRLVIINYPPYVVPGAHRLWDEASDARMQLYMKELDAITPQRGVARGDTTAYAYFKYHDYYLADGVHPSELGNAALGRLWAEAYKRIVFSDSVSDESSPIELLNHVTNI